MQRLSQCNPSVIDVWYCNRRPLLNGTNEEDDKYSTYNETDREGNKTDESDDDPPSGHNSAPGEAGVTVTYLHNLQWNAGVHNDNSEDDEEYGPRTSSEEEESITLSKNENDSNNHQNYPKNEIKQEEGRQEDEMEDDYHE